MILVIDENFIYEWVKNKYNNFRKSSCFDLIIYNYILILIVNQLIILVIFFMYEICVNLKCIKFNMYINNNVNEKDFVFNFVLQVIFLL